MRQDIADLVNDPENFDRLTRLAAKIIGVPSAFISLTDDERAIAGDPHPELCRRVLMSEGPLVVRNAEMPGVGAYAGVPLVVQGAVIGAFCIVDAEPRDWTPTQIEVLGELAHSAVREIELHKVLRLAEQRAQEAREARARLATLHAMVEDAEKHAVPISLRASDRERVLVADDDASIRALVHRVLAADGYEMLEARNGEETIDCMLRAKPDIVLLDLQMPAKSGWDVLTTRMNDEGLRKIPVIVVSARRGPDVARALASGAYALLSKPFEIQALKYLVRNCLTETRVHNVS